MIVSRPQPNALFALTIFIILSLALAFAGLQGPLEAGVWKWYNYIAVWFFGPLAFILSVRILLKFKVIYLSKGKIEVWYPFKFFRRKWDINDIESWKEETVKTNKQLFREMEIVFPNRKVKISLQENTSYLKIFDYLSQKAKKKRK